MPERFGLWRRLLKSALSVFCLSESELDTVHVEFQGFSIVIPSPQKQQAPWRAPVIQVRTLKANVCLPFPPKGN